MTPTYNETYVITLAFVDKLLEPATSLAERLQQAYDNGRGNVAGFFEWQRLGRVTVLQFERQISEDIEVLADMGREMTPETVVLQLAYELREAVNVIADVGYDTYTLATTIADALEAGGDEVKVAGLLCQMPKLRVTVEMAFPNLASRNVNVATMDEAMESLAERLGGELLSHNVEKLP